MKDAGTPTRCPSNAPNTETPVSTSRCHTGVEFGFRVLVTSAAQLITLLRLPEKRN